MIEVKVHSTIGEINIGEINALGYFTTPKEF